MSGSADEPASPNEAAAQMHEATERLRDKAWMFSSFSGSTAARSAAQSDADAEA
jgi:hypothetical protein